MSARPEAFPSVDISGKRPLPDGWRWVRLGEVCQQDRQIAMADSPVAVTHPYLGLEHIETKTGRILRNSTDETEEGQSTTFAFDSRHILYGKLRPYLNKVALPDFEGRCTTELIPLLPQDVDRHFLAWILRRPETLDAAMRGKTGSRMPRANIHELLTLEIPLPPVSEQRRIAAILNEQMAAVERARTAAENQLEAANALPAAYLRAVFDSPEAQHWPRKRLGEVCELLPAKSIATNGDTNVTAITTACLSETGFQPSGVKPARMWATDVGECVVSPGEILIARSNTPDLVGRVAMFSGNPKGAVASDLTIRIQAKNGLEPTFLTAYLSFLYVSGHWKERAGGASGSMKKITRRQIEHEEVLFPSLSEQQRIVARLSEQMATAEKVHKALEVQLDTINKLPAAFLCRAFTGELALEANHGKDST